MDISAYWKDTLAQDRQAMAGYFRPDAVIRWHCTNEQFTVPEFIRANCEYPGEWDGKIERTERSGDLLVTAVNVYPKDRSASFHVVSFFRLEDGTIAGSAATLYQCMQNAVRFGIPRDEAIRSATIHPAMQLGCADRVGSIAVGKQADFVICDAELNRKEVWLRGEKCC